MITATLTDTSGNTLLTLGTDPSAVVLNTLDLGYPSVRESSTALSGMDGELDTTALTGGRAIVAEVTLPASNVGAYADTIRGLMHPGRRYWLQIHRDDWTTGDRRIWVRGATLSLKNGALPVTAQLGWKAPRPALQAVQSQSVTLKPQANSAGGFTAPLVAPISATPGLVPGASIVYVPGNVPAVPVIDIYGPCTGPLFRVVDTGAAISMPNLTVQAGQFVRVDCAARTVLANNVAGNSQYNTVDFTVSTFPTLPTGSPQVVFSPASSSAGCQAVVTWTSLWV